MKSVNARSGKKRAEKVEETNNSSLKKDENSFPIVGIGASAGGLEAFEEFFQNMPADNGMAFVVIQHLDPNHVGIMPELLQRITRMKVFQATERLKVRPDSVYVIPPNKNMSLLKGSLHLFDPVESRGLRLPIDFFFRSLAEDQQEKSIGIILSGMGSDGSLGLKAIKEKNGIVLIQEPSTSKFDGMPRSAAEAVIADIMAPAGELPSRLVDYLKFIPAVSADRKPERINKSNLEKIIILLRDQTGHDFSLYKKNTLLRRIERRKGVHHINKINDYVRFLQSNPREVEILFKELLIGVTSFFRDAPVWDMLRDKFLPSLLEYLPEDHILRVWVPGCSTGEEAYSLAIVLREAIEKVKSRRMPAIQIFATDLDTEAIDKARKGVFPLNITADVSPDRLSRYFTLEAEGYRLINSIRELVVFAPQNVIKDPPFTKLDILSCRNMLIYMEPELQNKLIGLFNYSLNPGGLLILGTAETLGASGHGFDEMDGKFKIFRHSMSFHSYDLVDFPSSFHNRSVPVAEKKIPHQGTDNVQTLADQVLIQRFAPPSVLVNSAGDIIYITGRTGKYLEPVAGKANWNIYAMAREGLRSELPGAFHKIRHNYDPVVLRSVKVGTNGGTQLVDVTIQRLESPDALRDLVIVVFADVPAVIEHETYIMRSGKKATTGRLKELEIELQRRHEELQSLREEMQTSQEELKSTNEELQSTNEELQSTNEELMTSREEMQSLNEELQTVNNELQSKMNDYVRASDDMNNLLNSTEIATLFLDKDLNIRNFTDHVTKIFKIRTTDTGRPFTDLVTDLVYPELEAHAKQVIKFLTPVEKAIATHDDRWFNVRIMPYRTLDDRIDGLVITFSDITKAKKLEIELKQAIEALNRRKEKS